MQRLADRRAQDALLVLALLALAPISLVPGNHIGFSVPGDGAPPDVWWLAVAAALALPLLARRTAPGWVLVAVGLAFTARAHLHAGTAADLAVPIAVDAVAAYGTRRSLGALAVLLGGPVLLVASGANPGGTIAGAVAALLVNVALPLASGHLRRRRAPDPPVLPTPAAPLADLPQLTPREREVLGHVADGSTNAEIARALGISPETVKTYVQRITTKLGVPDRTAAALHARPPQSARR